MVTSITRRINPELTSIYTTPHAFIDKLDNPILIKPLSEKRHDQLIRIYLDYDPRPAFSGLPPIADKACIEWVEGMIRSGINLIAISFEDGIVGHTAIFPMDEHRCEMIVAVSREYQNIGIGTQLTRCIIQLAYELEFEKVWLSVETTNTIARRVYQKCGFEYVSHSEVHELDMILDLKHYRHMTDVTVGDVMKQEVVSIHESLTCSAAIELFLEQPVTALPVVDNDNEVRGILSETDLITVANRRQKVADVLTRQVIAVRQEYPLSKIIRLFQSKKIRCIPVIDDNMKLIGIVGRKEILAHYSRNSRP